MIKIDGAIFKQRIISGSNNLYNHAPEVDALNVFPVSDGDTGTNRNLTRSSGVKEVFNKNDSSIGRVAKDFAKGLLMGARGNSGVILSQIFSGFAQGVEGKDEIDALDLADALLKAKEVAYKAVRRPVEGTILTVIREVSAAFNTKAERNRPMDVCFDYILEKSIEALNHTPDLLPVLKEVGVVDSGGAGLVKVFEGFAKALHNQIVEKERAAVTENTSSYSTGKPIEVPHGSVQAKFQHEEFGYCTQFLLRLPPQDKLGDKKAFNEKRFKAVLEAHGNSIVFIKSDNLVKVHIHTRKPGNIFTYAQQFGEFKTRKCDNRSEQHEELRDSFQTENPSEEKQEEKVSVALKAAATVNAKRKPYALIAVAVGKGIEERFKESSVDYVVSGGQTRNPATEDFINAIKAVNADNVIILPNNGNIIRAANQAKELRKEECNVAVIPTKSIPEGLTACRRFNADASLEENVETRTENAASVKSGEITYAVKDTTIDGVTVTKDQFMGISKKKILCVHKHKINSLVERIEKRKSEEDSLITVICGQDVDEKERQAVEEKLNEKFSDDFEIQVVDGGQPVYSFFVSIE